MDQINEQQDQQDNGCSAKPRQLRLQQIVVRRQRFAFDTVGIEALKGQAAQLVTMRGKDCEHSCRCIGLARDNLIENVIGCFKGGKIGSIDLALFAILPDRLGKRSLVVDHRPAPHEIELQGKFAAIHRFCAIGKWRQLRQHPRKLYLALGCRPYGIFGNSIADPVLHILQVAPGIDREADRKREDGKETQPDRDPDRVTHDGHLNAIEPTCQTHLK